MCLTCNCREPFADHGDRRHLTYSDLVDAAAAAGITPDDAAANLTATLHAMHTSGDPGALFAEAAGLEPTSP